MKHNLPQRIFVAGIGTGVGKTLVASVLTEALQADYWKPVQCGNLENSDTTIARSLASNFVSKFYPEAYSLKTASSPHYAAKAEGIEIDISTFQIPTENRLIIEAPGGLMVPLNDRFLVIDLVKHLDASVILVARNYLGSINHTLLSIELIRQKGFSLLGIIFSGDNFLDNEEIIQHFSNVPVIGRIDESKNIDEAFVLQQALKLKSSLNQVFEL
ncbi:MAG: bioD [Bacteroidota bacterium]|nr:bioD [Bacteroidota bacterium]